MTTNGESASRGGEAPSFRVPKTGELVAQRLRARIIRGELAEGDSLPAEGALIEEFGVSRPTLREAYRVLETHGLLYGVEPTRRWLNESASGGVSTHRLRALLETCGFKIMEERIEKFSVFVCCKT